jgi:hypothetical protein
MTLIMRHLSHGTPIQSHRNAEVHSSRAINVQSEFYSLHSVRKRFNFVSGFLLWNQWTVTWENFIIAEFYKESATN